MSPRRTSIYLYKGQRCLSYLLEVKKACSASKGPQRECSVYVLIQNWFLLAVKKFQTTPSKQDLLLLRGSFPNFLTCSSLLFIREFRHRERFRSPSPANGRGARIGLAVEKSLAFYFRSYLLILKPIKRVRVISRVVSRQHLILNMQETSYLGGLGRACGALHPIRTNRTQVHS